MPPSDADFGFHAYTPRSRDGHLQVESKVHRKTVSIEFDESPDGLWATGAGGWISLRRHRLWRIRIRRRGPGAELRTTGKHLRRLLPQQVETAPISLDSDLNPFFQFIPRDPGRPVAFKLVKPPIQFFPLRVGDGNPLTGSSEAISKPLEKLHPLLGRNIVNVQCWIIHRDILPFSRTTVASHDA